jgi:hypothetical protein
LPQRAHHLLDHVAAGIGAVDSDVGPAVLLLTMPKAI